MMVKNYQEIEFKKLKQKQGPKSSGNGFKISRMNGTSRETVVQPEYNIVPNYS